MPVRKLPIPPVEFVAYEVQDGCWEELVRGLKSLIGHPVEVRLAWVGIDPHFDSGGVLEGIHFLGDGAEEELHLWVDGTEDPVVVQRQDVVGGEFSLGYVGFAMSRRYLTISYYSRLHLNEWDLKSIPRA